MKAKVGKLGKAIETKEGKGSEMTIGAEVKNSASPRFMEIGNSIASGARSGRIAAAGTDIGRWRGRRPARPEVIPNCGLSIGSSR